jgi:hypothetical protein
MTFFVSSSNAIRPGNTQNKAEDGILMLYNLLAKLGVEGGGGVVYEA